VIRPRYSGAVRSETDVPGLALATRRTQELFWGIDGDYHASSDAENLTEAVAAGGDEAKRAFDAMMGMRKIDIAAIAAAWRG
jgi:hypothetical protein